MNTIKLLLISFCCIVISVQCTKEPYVDEELLDEWYLQEYRDIENNTIYEKPDSLPRDIMLVFRKDDVISGRIVSFSIDGGYKIERNGSIELFLSYPRLPVCCQWDEYFIDTYSDVESYECDGQIMRLYYDGGNKHMLFTD